MHIRKSLYLLLIAAPAMATVDSGVVRKGDAYEIETGKGIVSVTPVTSDIFRVSAFPKGTPTRLPESQSAILNPRQTDIKVAETPEGLMIYSPTTTVRVERGSGAVSFHNASGSVLLSELGGTDNSGKVKSVTFEGDPEEIFYGAGERGHSLNLNGDSLVMYNRQNYGYTGDDPRISQMGITMPYFVSDLGYGVLFDDYNEALLVLGDTITYTSDTPKPLSYYFINGNGDISGVTSGFTELTGRQNLPPFWSLGYITSKYGYHNQDEATGAVDSLKNAGYPVDGIVLDLYWYGEETDMGRLAWDPAQWPDHRKMLSDLKDRGVNTVLISQPYINKKGAIDNYNLLSAEGMLVKDSLGKTHDVTTWVGDAGMFDVSNTKTREWLWNRLRPLTEEGVAGWWGDLGEPEVHPLTAVHANGETASQFHNVYGNEWSRIIYEGLRRDFPDMRPLLMMRGGTAGLQRYSVFPWTTDVSRSWGGLQPQVKLMLSSGLSGLAYMGSDLGGFAVDPENPRDEELYVRWVQMGAFSPTMRTHAQLQPEPYHYPEQEEILKRFVRMRYEWLPYNYTLAYENATKGWPLARPLNFAGDNADPKYAGVEDEYLWGPEVLVAPVMEKGARERKVVFPAGEWISWNNPSQRFKGETEANVKAPLGELPLFVRAGAFIPQYPQEIGNTSQYNPALLTIRYFPSDKETEYVLFDDDRKNPGSIAEGKFQLTYFTGHKKGGEVEISLRTNGGSYAGMPESRLLTFEIPDVAKPKSVSLSGGTPLPEFGGVAGIRQYGWSYDRDSRTLFVRFAWDYKPMSLTIR